jgi:hypothetical protein
MFKLLLILCPIVLVQLFFTANAAEKPSISLPNVNSTEGWELKLNKDDIQIYTRDWPDSSFVAVKTVQIIQSSLNNIVASFLDISAFPEWVKDMKEGKLIEDFNEKDQRTIYMHMGLPWPLKDRDLVIQQTLEQNPISYEVRLIEEKRSGLVPEKYGIIRIPSVNSEFVLTPLKEGGVRMIWQGHNEPGGFIPSFLVNWMIENIFYDSSLNMRKRFESLDYQKHTDKVADPVL